MRGSGRRGITVPLSGIFGKIEVAVLSQQRGYAEAERMFFAVLGENLKISRWGKSSDGAYDRIIE